jgi:hypothetical protein
MTIEDGGIERIQLEQNAVEMSMCPDCGQIMIHFRVDENRSFVLGIPRDDAIQMAGAMIEALSSYKPGNEHKCCEAPIH